jgi:CBS domain-containing protein
MRKTSVVLVRHILDAAQKRLAVLSEEALVPDAAEILANPRTPLVVVCDSDSMAVGVVSRTDIIRLLARARTAACVTHTGTIMTKDIVSCHMDQPLQQLWTVLNARSLRCAPILDHEGRPQGVVHGQDLVRALLNEETEEEELLRNYVMGVGYQ